MNRVGIEGRGESVWLGWFLCAVLEAFAPLVEQRRSAASPPAWRERAAALAETRSKHLAGMATGICAAFFDNGAAARIARERGSADRFAAAVLGRDLRRRPIRLARAAPWNPRSDCLVERERAGWCACSRRPSIIPSRIPATSWAIRPACAKTAASTRTDRCGWRWRGPGWATAMPRCAC